MSGTPQSPNPGYYPDGNGANRYWDGNGWTEQTQAVPDGGPSSHAQTAAPQSSRPWYRMKRWWLAGFVLVLIIGAAAGGGGDDEEPSASKPAASATDETEEEPVDVEPAVKEEPAVENKPVVNEKPKLSAGQANAVRAAENYLEMAPFSRTGLIGQLEFEDYSTEDATFAVDAIDADWNDQAVKAAENYLEMTAFSHSGLIEQLEFEGYTTDEATYGVSKTGL